MKRYQKELEFYLSQEKYRRMVEDDKFFDVTEEDVQRLLRKMACAKCSREEIIRVRKKYHPLLHDREAEFMNRLGLNYDDHLITLHNNSAVLRVNGYTETEWRMLVDDEYLPNYKAIKIAISRVRSRGDEEAVRILNMKYCTCFASRDEQILASHDIPLDTPYSVLTCISIDGRTFNLWHLLYDPSYVPSRQILVSQLHLLRKRGKYEEVKIIEDKYRTLLDPDGTQITEADIQEAQDFFAHFLE